MNANTMMEKISKTLKDDEKVIINVAHKGNWNGANVYEVTNKGVKWIKHIWNAKGTLMKEYRNRVMNH